MTFPINMGSVTETCRCGAQVTFPDPQWQERTSGILAEFRSHHAACLASDDDQTSASKSDGAEVCCDAAERLADIASEDPESDAMHRPVRYRCRCGYSWPCRTARAAGIGEVSS